MGATKSHAFTDDQNHIAELCKALAHPARIAIVQYLCEVKACIGNEIVEKIPLAQPTISRHLSELKKAGLVRGTVEGPSTCYCIDPEGWKKARKILEGVFTEYEGCC